MENAKKQIQTHQCHYFFYVYMTATQVQKVRANSGAESLKSALIHEIVVVVFK